MTLSNKDSLYIRGVAMAPNVPDVFNDEITQEQINVYITRFNSPNLDVEHSLISDPSLQIVQSYLLEEPEFFGDKLAPAGSFIIEARVKSEDIKQDIIRGKKNGLSVTTLSSDYLDSHGHSASFKSEQFFKEHQNLDNIYPHFISLVEKPANGYPVQFLNYEGYIGRTSNKCRDGVCMVAKLNSLNKKSESTETISLKSEPVLKQDYTLNEWKEACLLKVGPCDSKDAYQLPIKNRDGSINPKLLEEALNVIPRHPKLNEHERSALVKNLKYYYG